MFTIYSEICHVIIHKLASWKFFDSNNIRIINFACSIYFPLKHGHGITISARERSDFIQWSFSKKKMN